VSVKPVLIGLAVAAVLAAAVVSSFASSNADGLEWSIAKVTGTEQELQTADSAHEAAADVQERTAILPDYGFKQGDGAAAAEEDSGGPAVDAGTSVAGLAGAGIVLVVAAVIGLALYKRRKPRTETGT
jgi:cobalt/nickel transport system permease protein